MCRVCRVVPGPIGGILGSSGVDLVSVWDRLGADVWSTWSRSVVDLAPLWSSFRIDLRSDLGRRVVHVERVLGHFRVDMVSNLGRGWVGVDLESTLVQCGVKLGPDLVRIGVDWSGFR